MTDFDALPVNSEIIVSTGTPKYDRNLSDKILAAFNHAYAEGATAVAAVLRRALEEAEFDGVGSGGKWRVSGVLAEADLWMEFVAARDSFRRVFETKGPDPEELECVRAEMLAAYKRWSSR